MNRRITKSRGQPTKQESHRAVHFACLDCRVAFKKPSVDLLGIAETVRVPCPNCRKPMQYMGRTFQAPRRNATRQWRKVALLIKAGWRFDTYSGGSMPATLRTVEEFLGDPGSIRKNNRARIPRGTRS